MKNCPGLNTLTSYVIKTSQINWIITSCFIVHVLFNLGCNVARIHHVTHTLWHSYLGKYVLYLLISY